MRQERFRPFLPTVVLRGGSTPTPYPLGMGGFAGGQGENLGALTGRVDWDLEAIWELKNLGFGNAALIRERRASVDLVREQSYRFQDYIAKEVRTASGVTPRCRGTRDCGGGGRIATGMDFSHEESRRAGRTETHRRQRRNPRHSSTRSRRRDASTHPGLLQLLRRLFRLQTLRSVSALSKCGFRQPWPSLSSNIIHLGPATRRGGEARLFS